MSHPNDATLDDEPDILVEAIAKGPSTKISVWSWPGLSTGKPSFRGGVEFRIPGTHGASFQLPALPKQVVRGDIRNPLTTTYQNTSASNVPSTSVSKGDQSCRSRSVCDKPTKSYTTSCSTFARQSLLDVPGSPATATVADSVVDSPSPTDVVIPSASPILPAAADLECRPSKSLPPSQGTSQGKRGREEVEYSSGDEDQDGSPCKKRRIPETQHHARHRGA